MGEARARKFVRNVYLAAGLAGGKPRMKEKKKTKLVSRNSMVEPARTGNEGQVKWIRLAVKRAYGSRKPYNPKKKERKKRPTNLVVYLVTSVLYPDRLLEDVADLIERLRSRPIVERARHQYLFRGLGPVMGEVER